MRSRTTYSTTTGVAHAWANGATNDIKNSSGTVSTRIDRQGNVDYYSYSTVIGTLYPREKTVLLTKEKYTRTTTRHQSEISFATNHLTQIFYEDKEVEANVKKEIYNLKELCKKHQNARKADYSREIHALLKNLHEFLKFKKVDMRKYKWVSKLQKARINEILAYMLKLTEKEYKAVQARQKKALLEIKRKKEEDEKYLEDNKIEFENILNKKRSAFKAFGKTELSKDDRLLFGAYKGRLSFAEGIARNTFLRVSKDKVLIETSKGANVPVTIAKKLWKKLQRGDDLKGMNLGIYKVTSFENNILTVGCHKLPLSELEKIANELGL